MTPHGILGLTEDADAQQIRKAYAAALKRTRPEDDAAGFQRLHEAYREAMHWLSSRPTAPALDAEASCDTEVDWGGDAVDDGDPAYDQDWDEPLDWAVLPVPGQPLDAADQACVEAIVAAACGQWPKQLSAWLLHYEPLYAPGLKQRVTIPLLIRLLEIADRLDPRAVDAIVEFFGMDELGVVPYRYQDAVWHLRLRARFDYPQFEAEVLRRCRSDASGDGVSTFALEAWLEGHYPLDDFRMRDYAGERLHARLMANDVPALKAGSLEVVCAFFRYQDADRLLERHRALWAIENVRAWGYDIFLDRRIGQLRRPWSPWRAVLYEVIHSDAKVIAELGRRLSAGFDGLPPGIDQRQFAFFSHLADPRYLGRWRWRVIAGKGLGWGLFCAIYMLVRQRFFPELLVLFPLARIALGALVALLRALMAPTGGTPLSSSSTS